jgi:hypothetical protein
MPIQLAKIVSVPFLGLFCDCEIGSVNKPQGVPGRLMPPMTFIRIPLILHICKWVEPVASLCRAFPSTFLSGWSRMVISSVNIGYI